MRTAVIVLCAVVTISGQGAAPPAFEVVSVKRNHSGDQNASVRPAPGGGLLVKNNTLRSLLRNAYMFADNRLFGGPAWLDTDRFDITATGSGDDVPFEMMLERMRTLLADRFGVVVHREMREMSVYALVPVREDRRFGPQLRPSAIDCRPSTAAVARSRPAGIVPPGQPPGEQPVCGGRTKRGLMMIGGAGLDDFARELAAAAGRPVIDRTGLIGTFDLTVAWDPDPTGAADEPASPVRGLSLFTAVQEQLGLKLDPQRAPVEVLVIDRAEPPTEN
jgi:uncharacterized protein (TIGR03435 family)